MAAGRETLVRYIRRVLLQPEADETADAVLLGRFLATRDETAFATLVRRHGPLVLAVCRRVLGNVHDAEEAFQAAFLVLARKAASVHPREALAAWLHGVAHRVALKTRSAKLRRQALPLPPSPADPRPDPLAELSARELLALIDEEVRQLPQAYRLPVILCCLEGRSQEEAARQLGWTPGSVKGRLERGRARLHARLVRRGLTLSAALAATELSRATGSAALMAPLVASTVRAALGFATARATKMVGGMTLARLRLPAALLLATSLLVAGFALAQRTADAPPADKGEMTAPQASARNETAAPPQEASRRIEVSGRVLDPAGQPFAGARLYVGYAPRRHEPQATAHRPAYRVRATSGTDGRFRFAFTRSELDERYLDASRPVVVAVADGFGLDWAEIGRPAGDASLSLRLVEDVAVEGRILDQNRRPVAGARIRVRELSGDAVEGLTRFFRSGARSSRSFKSCRGPLPGQPSQVTTDDDGRFRLTGVGRDRLVTLALQGSAIPPRSFGVATCATTTIPSERGIHGAIFELVAPPSRFIRGTVRDSATGRPVAGVKVSVPVTGATTRTDKDGHYELLVHSSLVVGIVLAQPQPGQPYLAASARLPSQPRDSSRDKSPDALTTDFNLVSGVLLRGRVTDQTTGKPPKRGRVEYYPLAPPPAGAALPNANGMPASSSAALASDGSYRLAVLPGPGLVLVAVSPRDEYATAHFDDRELNSFFRNGQDRSGSAWVSIAVGGQPCREGESLRRCVNRYNALSLINLKARAPSAMLDLTVQPVRGLRGTVVDPDGKPLSGVRVRGLTSTPDPETLASPSFTVEGLNSRHPRQLVFYHREKELGKVVTLLGDQAGALTVRLTPCGMVQGRIVGKGGRPVSGVVVWFFHDGSFADIRAETDREGRFRVGLVEGQQYSLRVSGVGRLLRYAADVKVASGHSKDLGDFPVSDE